MLLVSYKVVFIENEAVLQAGALQLYLNETPAQVFSCEFCFVSQNTYLQNICVGNWFFTTINHYKFQQKILSRKSLIYNLTIFYLLLYYFKTIDMSLYIP